jgi:hypothetical protein
MLRLMKRHGLRALQSMRLTNYTIDGVATMLNGSFKHPGGGP